ncbi:MAG: nucleoside-diphosphate kinase [Bacteroidetes bacterium RIFOXYA12_FULL_35_11]|nr:MAG: nucleoside-diphosphate kinase [Bacteroidetes bacterium GWF2_35_48]OFY75255.1 MAG: nucleoside-diphosphate kinase [Bacteroidetes bacterium RIFOXYA12_FULL_35_11]OFY96922.1 MAG: nucleoside-diphosphate kinase [Bacteroidetes bacterium RIFOXYB2_FULL_35_7]OFY97722.1 MAG: nucleoside-diphosphate kinase [Bacteroidetes bacterium RIFOXYC12_FULL_35_7]HBX51006.1 nucleoside-diphosphate kinase [Bacteroidales bacterium]
MEGNFTLSIIKPRAVQKGFIIPILEKCHEAGFRISAMKLVQLTKKQVAGFYKEHEGKSFFESLVEFMSSDRVVVILFEKDNAVADFRKLIGATDPSEAAPGTIRNLYAESKEKNAVHGSDSDESALRESDFFFSKMERF